MNKYESLKNRLLLYYDKETIVNMYVYDLMVLDKVKHRVCSTLSHYKDERNSSLKFIKNILDGVDFNV